MKLPSYFVDKQLQPNAVNKNEVKFKTGIKIFFFLSFSFIHLSSYFTVKKEARSK